MSKNIGIVTVTYNSSAYIHRFLKSLKNHKHNIKDIVVVENNSNEKIRTQKIVEEFKHKNKDLEIKFIKNRSNYGFAKSCNQGSEITNGNYLLFINPDTEVEVNSLSTLQLHMEKTKADLIGGKVSKYGIGKHNTVVRKPNLKIGLLEFSNLGKLLGTKAGNRDFYYLDNNKVYNAKKDVLVDALGGAYLMVRREAFKKLGGFDESFFMYLEDVDLGVRANKMKMKVVYCPHSVIQHEGGASSKNKYKIRHQAWYDSRKKYFKKHFGALVNLIIQPLYTIEELLLKILRPA
jgi:GT2 family glycosyltransferase